MFFDCDSLTSIDISNFNTGNVTDMHGMFSDCAYVTDFNFGNIDTGNVTDMCNMFEYCENLISLDLSMFGTSNVTNMHSMFSTCRSLEHVNLSNFDTRKVTIMNHMFYNCYVLSMLNLTSFDTHNVTEFSGMFTSCGWKGENSDQFKIYITRWKWVVSATAEKPNMFSQCQVSSVTYGNPLAAYSLRTAAMGMRRTMEDNSTDTTIDYGIGDTVPFSLIATMP